MQFAVAAQSLKCGDLTVFGPERGNKATVDRLTIKPDRARTAISGVTTFPHAEPSPGCAKTFASTDLDEVPRRMICR